MNARYGLLSSEKLAKGKDVNLFNFQTNICIFINIIALSRLVKKTVKTEKQKKFGQKKKAKITIIRHQMVKQQLSFQQEIPDTFRLINRSQSVIDKRYLVNFSEPNPGRKCARCCPTGSTLKERVPPLRRRTERPASQFRESAECARFSE